MNTIVLEKNEAGEEYPVDVFAKMTKSRVIYITGEIDFKSATDIVATLLYLRSKKSKDSTINIFMNAWSGDLRSVFMICDTFMSMKDVPIRVVVTGESEGAASLLLAAANKSQACEHSVIHVGPIRLYPKHAKIDESERYMKRTKNDNKKIHALFSKKTGKSIKEIEGICEKDTYLSPKEALALGLIDSIVGEK